MKPIIKVENLSKQYRLGTIGTGTLSNDLKRWWHKVRGKEDPFLTVGESNDRTSKGSSDYVWALKDINFEVMPGEILGIIGKNGAGKSTLLKILSKVTGPTTGRILYDGRIGSLLEVGTGFHPELTGRENIYLNGAILGMTRHEIRTKLDEIIDFSGCERYIDTPVKRYSSGMTVRLGFAVAAHLEPEILVVDEVLAVGDAEFQKKAIGKMQDVSRNHGRTVLFVSHNMGAVKNLCTKGLVINNGTITFQGDIESVIYNYLMAKADAENDLMNTVDRLGNGKIRVTNIVIYGEDNQEKDEILAGSKMIVKIFYRKFVKDNISVIPTLSIINQFEQFIYSHHSRLNGVIFKNSSNEGYFSFEIASLNIVPGSYYIGFSLLSNSEFLDSLSFAKKFSIISSNFYNNGETPPSSHSLVLIEAKWKLNENI
ncbi:ABC transporter ATP-binding protein [Runella salmonicolor]|uniref:ABC transporter ATP-binding protein n=1 Tax=Runella salmonicolor TaxID=2950278 RepID=A0ABT1FHG7_9BACT|nr:ABC transporter ATP-binding protein [Runella salmonicolor]MCP1381211.1 ABC transporter ATP-binding protein [Runella salmonicolor]